MLTPLLSLARSVRPTSSARGNASSAGIRLNAPSHPLRPAGPGCPTPTECHLPPGEDCICGWHESTYELLTGVEVVEREWVDAGDLGIWADALEFA